MNAEASIARRNRLVNVLESCVMQELGGIHNRVINGIELMCLDGESKQDRLLDGSDCWFDANVFELPWLVGALECYYSDAKLAEAEKIDLLMVKNAIFLAKSWSLARIWSS